MTGRIAVAHLAGSIILLAAPGANVTPAPKKAPVTPEMATAATPETMRSQPAFRRYVHPEAKAMAGVDLARLQSSPLGKRFAAQLDSFGVRQKASAQGMDFVSDIDKVLLSSPGEAGSAGGAAKLSEEAPFVVAMQGRFKLEKIRKTLLARKAKRQFYQGAEMWMPAQGDTGLAIVSAQVMLLGDRQSLRASLDQQASGAQVDSEVAGRADELAAIYDLWLVSGVSLDGVRGSAPVPQAELLNGVDQFELGVSLRDGLRADVSLHGRTPEDTSKLGAMLAGLKAMTALTSQQNKEPEMAAMLDKIQVGTTAERVMVSFQVNQKELDQTIETAIARRNGGGGKAGSQPAALVARPPAAPQAPLVVRIYNAEGGDREFPLNR